MSSSEQVQYIGQEGTQRKQVIAVDFQGLIGRLCLLESLRLIEQLTDAVIKGLNDHSISLSKSQIFQEYKQRMINKLNSL